MSGGMFDHRATEPTLRSQAIMLAPGPLTHPRTTAGVLRAPHHCAGRAAGACGHRLRSDGPHGGRALVKVTDGFARLAPGQTEAHLDLLATGFGVPTGAEMLRTLSTANFPRLDTALEPYTVKLCGLAMTQSAPHHP